jgi:hypothetical protein
MKHYAKIIKTNSKRKKFLVEIWSTTLLDELNHDEMKDYKSFWTVGAAEKWITKRILGYNLQENHHVFITDEMISRKEF